MNLPPIVVAKLEERIGVSLGHPSDRDIQILSNDIEEETKCRLGVNTLKRLLGRIADSTHQSRPGTLNVIARYLGSPNWPSLLQTLSKGSSSFTSVEGELRTSDLSVGQMVEIEYLPARSLRFASLGGEQLEIVQSVNSKLQVGDVCTISSFIEHYPLVIRNVVRQGEVLGSYSAARLGGLTAVRLLK